MTSLEDRRQKRSDDPLVALHYHLARARQDGRLDAIVVADDSGVVVAGAGAWPICEELAAYAPLLAHGIDEGVLEPSRLAELRADVDVKTLLVDGHTVLLCARGGGQRSLAMQKAAEGVARILKKAA